MLRSPEAPPEERTANGIIEQGDKGDRTRARVKKWQARFLAALAQAPSVSHAAMAAGVHRSTCYEWRDNNPQFAKAWEQALETAVDGLVVAAFQRALKGSDTLLTFLLRCHRPATYNIPSHAENVNENPDDKKLALNILYSTGNQSLAQLLDFPVHVSMKKGHEYSPEPEAEKQRRLTASAPEQEKISDAPPPEIVDKRFTGRIPREWKGNGK